MTLDQFTDVDSKKQPDKFNSNKKFIELKEEVNLSKDVILEIKNEKSVPFLNNENSINYPSSKKNNLIDINVNLNVNKTKSALNINQNIDTSISNEDLSKKSFIKVL